MSAEKSIASTSKSPRGITVLGDSLKRQRLGFYLFARQQDHPKLRRILDTHEITARIFAL